jgi:preprotein translocase subunit SecA
MDALEKKHEVSEKTLLDILPEAFAVVKETARRFKDNSNFCNCMHWILWN